MRNRWISSILVFMAVSSAPFLMGAQENAKPPANPKAPVPRTTDGKVDLSGFWATPTGPGETESIAMIFGKPLQLGRSHDPWFLTPWSRAQFDYNQDPTQGINAHGARLELNPTYAHCIPLSLPQ